MTKLVRIITRNMKARDVGAPSFECWLGDEMLRRSAAPLGDCARLLLERGETPETLITVRNEASGAKADSWIPLPISEAAKWTAHDTDAGLRRRLWEPDSRFAADAFEESGAKGMESP